MPAGAVGFTSNYTNLVTLRGIQEVIFNKWDNRESVGDSIFNLKDSNQFREHSQTVGGVGLMDTKLEGQSINYTSLNEGFSNTFTHVDYGLGFRVTREMLRDELYGVMDDLGVELANSAHATDETILADHLNNAFDSSYTGPNGVELCSTAHIREDGSTYANELSTASDLSLSSLEQATLDFRNFRDGGGKRITIRPKYLIVPTDLMYTALKLVGSTNNPQITGGYGATSTQFGDQAVNPIHDLGLKVIVWDYLTDTDAWFLAADKAHHGLTKFVREKFWTEDIYDFDTKDYKISGMFAQSSGWADPRGFFGSPGAA